MEKNPYSDSLDALLARARKKNQIGKLTRNTAARFRQSFGATLENPEQNEVEDDTSNSAGSNADANGSEPLSLFTKLGKLLRSKKVE